MYDEIRVNQLLGLYNNNDCKGMGSLFQQNKVPPPQTVASRACTAINRGLNILFRVGYLDTSKPIKFRKNLNQNKEERESWACGIKGELQPISDIQFQQLNRT